MSLKADIVVVSGLPRSGTSLMMQMLDRGGIPALTDQIRSADADNPHGYYEFEGVKQTKRDSSWLPAARGKTVKMVSSLLYDLPPSERYRVIFMQRSLEEVLASQEIMLQRRGRPAAPRESMRSSFELHLERLFRWLAEQPHLRLLVVDYNRLMKDAQSELDRVGEFLDKRVDVQRMLTAIDHQLYRNRSPKDGSN